MNRLLQRGWIPLGRIGRLPLRAHWTVPFALLLFSGGRLAPGLWLGIVLVLLVHELGHALLVKRVGLVNLGIELTGFGGLCRFTGEVTPERRAIVAWGGVLGQLTLFVPALLLDMLVGPWPSPWIADLVYALIVPNAMLAGLNLLPIPPLDGADAWKLMGIWRARWSRRRRKPKASREPDRPQTLREALEEAEDAKRSQ